ncbi:MAG TPA: prolyl oligopeptidase family serine peptidase [Bacillota bacterium]|nr:prolyl oligopeptidase family serine peptidase [Bacillota bacterium]
MAGILKLSGNILVESMDFGPAITAFFIDKFTDMPPIERIDVNNVSESGTLSSFSTYRCVDGTVVTFDSYPDQNFLSPMDFLEPREKNELKKEIVFKIRLKESFTYDNQEISLIEVNIQKKIMAPSIAMFSDGVIEFDRKIAMDYSFYMPKSVGPVPLIVWLHGAGEGGRSVWRRLLKPPVSRLVEPHIQNIFGGVAILIPQAETFWMDDGKGNYTVDGTTMYKKALHGLITGILRSHPRLDPKRVYVGGCSNGGFMTIKMLLSYPELFAAGFPVCEVYNDRWLKDEDIRVLSTIPLWFVQSRDDPVVRPEDFCLPTCKRLLETKSNDIHLTLIEHVTDQTGKYTLHNGAPYRYHGHFSWITALNDWCVDVIDGKKTTMFSWLSRQRKP